MRSFLKTFGGIVFAAVLVFAFVGCDGLFETNVPVGTTLTNGTFAEGTITAANTASNPQQYSFEVVSGQTYYVWWNDSYNTTRKSSLFPRTGDVIVSAEYWDGTSIFSDGDEGYSTSERKSFTASKNGWVHVSVSVYSTYTGTYAVGYSTINVRPDHAPAATSLTAGTWLNGTIATTNTASNPLVYRFSVTQGQAYYVWWDDGYGTAPDSKSGTKTGDVNVTAYYANETSAKIFNDIDSGYAIGTYGTANRRRQSFTADHNGTVIVTVRYNTYITGGGTFGLVYTTTDERPANP